MYHGIYKRWIDIALVYQQVAARTHCIAPGIAFHISSNSAFR
jgi:hypothetical protein